MAGYRRTAWRCGLPLFVLRNSLHRRLASHWVLVEECPSIGEAQEEAHPMVGMEPPDEVAGVAGGKTLAYANPDRAEEPVAVLRLAASPDRADRLWPVCRQRWRL